MESIYFNPKAWLDLFADKEDRIGGEFLKAIIEASYVLPDGMDFDVSVDGRLLMTTNPPKEEGTED